jgi:branched-chain amino acid transport system permease protein
MDFWFSYIALASIYVLLGLSTNLLVGIAGIFSVSQAAVFGVGAYIVAYLLMNDVMSFLPALAIAVFTNWTGGTGGANGLPGIPPPDLAGKALESTGSVVSLCATGMVLGCLIFWLVMRAPFGRLLRAIREDELAVAAAGKSVLRAKVSAAALAGAFAGTAGGMYATFLSFIDPSSFDLDASILLLTMVVVGGARTLVGSIIGPFLLLALPQILTLVDIPTTVAAASLIAFMLFRPQGLAGEKL